MHTSLIYIRPYIVTLKSVNLKHWKYFSYNFTSPNNRLTLFLLILSQEKRLAHATTKKMFTEATKTNNSCSLCLPSLWYLIRRALETECKVFINLLWPSDSFLSSVGGTRVWDLHEHNSCNLFESYCTVKETSQGFKFPHGLSFQNDGPCSYNYFTKFARILSKLFFIWSLWGIACRVLRWEMNLGIRL